MFIHRAPDPLRRRTVFLRDYALCEPASSPWRVSFPGFSALPRELRSMIWHAALPRSRIVNLQIDIVTMKELQHPFEFASKKASALQNNLGLLLTHSLDEYNEYEHAIWQAAAEPLPVTLFVNQESRNETLALYGVTYRSVLPRLDTVDMNLRTDVRTLNLKPFFFAPQRDQAYISNLKFYNPGQDGEMLISWLVQLDRNLPGGLQAIRHLQIRKFSYRVHSSRDLSTIDPDSSLSRLARILPIFSGLETLVLKSIKASHGTPIYPNGDPAWSELVDDNKRRRINEGFNLWLRRTSYHHRQGPRAPKVFVEKYEHLKFH